MRSFNSFLAEYRDKTRNCPDCEGKGCIEDKVEGGFVCTTCDGQGNVAYSRADIEEIYYEYCDIKHDEQKDDKELERAELIRQRN